MKKMVFLSLAFTTVVFARSVTIDVAEHIPIYESKPVTKTVKKCDNNQNIAGTVIGAVGGGLIGNQFGGGSGKKLATVGGAIAGGIVGNKIEDEIKNGECKYKEETIFEDVLVGYKNVGYYKGKKYIKNTEKKQPKIIIQVN